MNVGFKLVKSIAIWINMIHRSDKWTETIGMLIYKCGDHENSQKRTESLGYY